MHPPLHRRTALVRAAFVAAATLATATACRNAGPAFGSTPGEARANADGMLTALEQRFTGVERDPRYAHGRSKMFAAALVPSRIYGDTSIWNYVDPTSGLRTLTVTGHFSDGHYRFTHTPLPAAPPIPHQLGDSRHVIALGKLSGNEYSWSTDVVTNWGTVTGNDLARALNAILATAATHPDADLRTNYRTAFPRTTEALGRLMSLDTLHAVPAGEGSARITLFATLHPDQIKSTFPAYSAYLTKYSTPARYYITLVEPDSTRWLDIAAEQNHIKISLRATADGHLAPFVGPPRAMPATLMIRSSWFEKMAIFTIGMSDLDAEFTMTTAPHERAWVFGLHHPPQWHLPLDAARFIHASITRPFEGAGTVFRLAISDSTGGPSLFRRQVSSAIKETAVTRWLGDVGGSAANEFTGASESEENRFDAELFAALRADIDALGLTAAAP
ncbi:MAG TPA: hypothetical protein VNW46_12630 [Gemmatimonadaceae bacterium]|nr:hypothetical protein [Gemmatimonadaceae bacterium]